MNKKIRRREFFRKTALLTAGLFAISEVAPITHPAKNNPENERPLLNPAFRMKELENGELELFTHLKDKSRLSELFGGLDAEVIREIVHEKNPLEITEMLAYRYNIPNQECRRKIKRLLIDLHRSGIIYYGDRMLVKIQEE